MQSQRFAGLGLLCVVLALPLFTPPSMAGDPPCVEGCATDCTLTPYDPTYAGHACIAIDMVWTRKQDGCANSQCQQCRECSGRIRSRVSLDATCFANHCNDVKVDWNSVQTDPQQVTTVMETGTGGVTWNPTLSEYEFVDIRQVDANCGNYSTYTIHATPGCGEPTHGSAIMACDACEL